MGLFWLELVSGNLGSSSGVAGETGEAGAAGAAASLLLLLWKAALQKGMGWGSP